MYTVYYTLHGHAGTHQSFEGDAPLSLSHSTACPKSLAIFAAGDATARTPSHPYAIFILRYKLALLPESLRAFETSGTI